jgi:tryptophan synthase
MSFVPLIAPSTSPSRLKLLCKLATSFIYVVSRMGVTGASGTMNSNLPELLKRVHDESGGVPIALGFGVSTREHFVSIGSMAEGVVIGSQIVGIIAEAAPGTGAKKVEEYCQYITERKVERGIPLTREVGMGETLNIAQEPTGVTVDEVIKPGQNGTGPGLADQIEALNVDGNADPAAIPARFGEFGGQYVPESLMDCLRELEDGFNKMKDDPKFWEEYKSYYPYMGRPGQLHMAERLTEHAGGANIWLKREDLNHTGSHKINNALGQVNYHLVQIILALLC